MVSGPLRRRPPSPMIGKFVSMYPRWTSSGTGNSISSAQASNRSIEAADIEKKVVDGIGAAAWPGPLAVVEARPAARSSISGKKRMDVVRRAEGLGKGSGVMCVGYMRGEGGCARSSNAKRAPHYTRSSGKSLHQQCAPGLHEAAHRGHQAR